MNNFWGIIIASVISVIGIIINIVITNRFSEKIKTNNQIEIEQRKGEITAEVNRQLEQFKQEYDRNKVTEDRKHQIAQEAYRDFFKEKFSTYIALAKLTQEHKVYLTEFIPNVYRHTIPYTPQPLLIEESPTRHTEIMIEISKIIIDKRVFLSKELIEIFDSWYQKTAFKKAKAEHSLKEHHQKYPNEARDMGDISVQSANLSNIGYVFKQAEAEQKKLFKQIELDIQLMREKYDL